MASLAESVHKRMSGFWTPELLTESDDCSEFGPMVWYDVGAVWFQSSARNEEIIKMDR